MRTQDYLKLKRYFENHVIKKPTVNGFKEMYILFSRFGISNKEELYNSVDLFNEFITEDLFSEYSLSKIDWLSINKRLHAFNSCLKSRLQSDNSQLHFAEIVKQFITNKQKDRVLDVGAGSIPHSSISIAEDIDNVTSMDHLMLSELCLDKLNIKGKYQYFGEGSQVRFYDYIVGQCPCSAIESVVKKSAKNNKGYFLQLCNCYLPSHADSWEEVLPEYDSNIKFYQDYAYNLDANPSTVEKIIEKYNPDRHVIQSIKPTITVSLFQDTGEKGWEIDDTPNNITTIDDDSMDYDN